MTCGKNIIYNLWSECIGSYICISKPCNKHAFNIFG